MRAVMREFRCVVWVALRSALVGQYIDHRNMHGINNVTFSFCNLSTANFFLLRECGNYKSMFLNYRLFDFTFYETNHTKLFFN